MFTAPPTIQKNLRGIDFIEKMHIQDILDELQKTAESPYSASLPLLASSELGDKKRYAIANTKMLQELDRLEHVPESYPQWMRNTSFKAWMWGRVLLAADNMQEGTIIAEAQNNLSGLLAEPITEKDNMAFFAWAWGYRAALHFSEFTLSYDSMMQHALQLTKKYQENPEENTSALSDVWWAWVMNLSAAARVGARQKYVFIKAHLQHLAESHSISASLETALLRTKQANDYPAWALAKIQYAAATMDDRDLYVECEKSLFSSIEGARVAGAKAEYILAVLENQLGMIVGRKLEAGIALKT